MMMTAVIVIIDSGGVDDDDDDDCCPLSAYAYRTAKSMIKIMNGIIIIKSTK